MLQRCRYMPDRALMPTILLAHNSCKITHHWNLAIRNFITYRQFSIPFPSLQYSTLEITHFLPWPLDIVFDQYILLLFFNLFLFASFFHFLFLSLPLPYSLCVALSLALFFFSSSFSIPFSVYLAGHSVPCTHIMHIRNYVLGFFMHCNTFEL